MDTKIDSRELSKIVVPLLKGVVYEEENHTLWGQLLGNQTAVVDYVAVLGLDLIVDEAEGYAYLRSEDDDENETEKLPRLIARRPLSFPVSLLLALLRKKLVEFDARGGETRLVLSREEVVELMRIFLPEGTNEVKLVHHVEATVSKIAKLGFVRNLRGQKNMIEVRRILKAYVDGQWLSDFDARLQQYREQLVEDSGDPKHV